MGLLDDAIREHLELKRRHGADASEVAKQEHEALGPVRRDDALEVPPALDPAAHAVAEEEERAYEESVLDAGDDPLEHAPLAEDELAHPRGVVHVDPVEEEHVEVAPEAVAEPEPILDAPEPEPEPVAPILPEPAAPAHESSRVDPDEPGQETVAFSALEEADERPRAAPPAGTVPADPAPAEDELAETPEFLQETPEHDRLWFEQKPPRDFDF